MKIVLDRKYFEMKITSFLFFSIAFGLSCNAQYVFKVKSRLSSHLYYNVPNPLEIAIFGYQPYEVRLAPFNGKLDTINGIAYWTPYFDESYLIISVWENEKWHIKDTINAKITVINPEDFSVKINPVSYHYGLPDIKRFNGLDVYLSDEKYAHLNMDTIARIKAFDIIIFDSLENVIDRLYFNSEIEKQNKKAVALSLRKYDVKNHIFQFENIRFECRCWSNDNKWKAANMKKELWVIDEIPVVKTTTP